MFCHSRPNFFGESTRRLSSRSSSKRPSNDVRQSKRIDGFEKISIKSMPNCFSYVLEQPTANSIRVCDPMLSHHVFISLAFHAYIDHHVAYCFFTHINSPRLSLLCFLNSSGLNEEKNKYFRYFFYDSCKSIFIFLSPLWFLTVAWKFFASKA